MQQERQRQKQAIEAWMLTIVKDGGIERCDDLHIDTIDDKWKSRRLWIEGALAAHQMALELRDLHRLPVTVEVAFSLQAGTRRVGVDFHTPGELLARLDWTPPSLYLFWRGKEPWVVDTGVQELDTSVLGSPDEGVRCYYAEFQPAGSSEFCRTVFLQG